MKTWEKKSRTMFRRVCAWIDSHPGSYPDKDSSDKKEAALGVFLRKKVKAWQLGSTGSVVYETDLTLLADKGYPGLLDDYPYATLEEKSNSMMRKVVAFIEKNHRFPRQGSNGEENLCGNWLSRKRSSYHIRGSMFESDLAIAAEHGLEDMFDLPNPIEERSIGGLLQELNSACPFTDSKGFDDCMKRAKEEKYIPAKYSDEAS